MEIRSKILDPFDVYAVSVLLFNSLMVFQLFFKVLNMEKVYESFLSLLEN